MAALLSLLGWGIVAVAVVDALWTVLRSEMGGGPVTTAVTGAVRRVVHAAARGRRTVLSATGPLALIAIFGTWLMMVLVGFTLALGADADAVRAASTGEPTTWAERAYFVGYTLFTLGTGEYVPTTDAMRAVTVIMNAAGMVLVTLSITYLLPVVSASVQSRQFASSVLSLGDDAEELLTGAWNGTSIPLDHQLRTTASDLSALAQQHLAYPVLHLFHAVDPGASAPRAVAVLDDTLSLLDVVDPAVAPEGPARTQLRASIERYLATFGAEADDGPTAPPPRLGDLARAGIPLTMDQQAFEQTVVDGARRRRLRGVLVVTGLADDAGDRHPR